MACPEKAARQRSAGPQCHRRSPIDAKVQKSSTVAGKSQMLIDKKCFSFVLATAAGDGCI